MVERYRIGSLDRSEVLRYLGYRGQAISEELSQRIDAQVARSLKLATPSGVWRIVPVSGVVEKDGVPEVTLEGTSLVLSGHSIARHLRGAVGAALLVVTTGMGVERELRRLALTSPLDQAVFDAAGTELAERTADACEASIVAAARERGLYTNFRFSPGYGDLPLKTQPELLRTLDAQRQLGVTLTESLLMIPTKSVSAVIGLFPEPRDEKRQKSCSGCRCFDFCNIRLAGTTCRS